MDIKELYPIIIALGFNGLDILLGVVTAIKAKNIQSAKLRDGLFKKVGFITCYFVAWLLDNHGNAVGFTFGVNILPLVIFYVCTTEVVSILENVSKLNPDILPEKLTDMFQISKKGK